MKHTKTKMCLAVVAAVVIPLTALAESAESTYVKVPKHANSDDRFWSEPANSSVRWETRDARLQWKIPPASQRWQGRDLRLQWKIPRTAADLQEK